MDVSRIELDIGELVLDGFPRAHRDVVASAFTRELSRLLYERGVPSAASPASPSAASPTSPSAASPAFPSAASPSAGHLALPGDRDVSPGDDAVHLPPLPPTAGPRRLGQALARAVHSRLVGGAE